MTIPYNENSIPGRTMISYRTNDAHRGFPQRQVEALATPDELAHLAAQGYLVRERLLPMNEVERLRVALGEAIAQDTALETGGGKSFGGVFIRHLMDKHPAFLDFLKFAPTLSIARALLGPAVSLRGFTGRVCYPDDPYQETEWHFHQRVVPDPLPPWFSPPNTLDVLLYLDDTNDLNGPLCVVPGSHTRSNAELATGDFADKPDQVILPLPAGSCVFAHGNLWHRALPTRPSGTLRRLLLFGYGPAWMKPSVYGQKPPDGLTQRFLASGEADEETRELLNAAGYM